MVLCRDFPRGTCRYGADCRYEHPGQQTKFNNSNRFAPLSNQGGGGGGRGRSGAFGGGSDSRQEFGVTVDNIRQDLNPTTDRPIWPFSAYAPGQNAPRQLLEGPFEQSPEELRLLYYLARATGNEEQYKQQEAAILNEVNSRIQTILSDPESAKKYVLDGQNEHPNRLDQVVIPKQPFPWAERPRLGHVSGPPSSFGAASNGGGAFGQAPSNAPTGPRAAFGAPSPMGQGSAFGQSSALGGSSAFGKPSQMGGGSGTAFGQASNLGTTNALGGAQKPAAFGQSSFGQPSQPTSAFGQPSQPTSAFGQASKPAGFGQPSQPPLAFGQPPLPTSAFGQPSQPASAFGQPSQPAAFGQASKPAAGFAQPSAFGAAAQAQQSAFGQPSQPGAFGSPQPAQTGGSTFGQASAFGANVPKQSPFAAAAAAQNQNQQPAGSSPFMKPGSTFGGGFGNQQAQSNTGFGQPSQPTSNGFGSAPTAPKSFGAASTGTGFGAAAQGQKPKPTHFDGKPIEKDKYDQPAIRAPAPTKENPNRTILQRVWFPNGAPTTQAPDTEASPEVYMGEMGKAIQEAYEYMRNEGKFKDGIMPEVPPKRDWVSFDL